MKMYSLTLTPQDLRVVGTMPIGEIIFAVTICLMDIGLPHKKLGAEAYFMSCTRDMSYLKETAKSLMVRRKTHNQTNKSG